MKFFASLLLAILLLPSIAHAIYDPTEGRWITRDPIGEQGGTNLYAYCVNDPINRVDPMGLDANITYTDRNGKSAFIRIAPGAVLNNFLLGAGPGSIQDIRFEGHGNPSQQFLSDYSGADFLQDVNGVVSLRFVNPADGKVEANNFAALLAGKLSPNATIELNGCHTAAWNGVAANNITTDLANNLNHQHAITGQRFARIPFPMGLPWAEDAAFGAHWPDWSATNVIGEAVDETKGLNGATYKESGSVLNNNQTIDMSGWVQHTY